ncbi:hypothetical protein LEP1GSC193_0309 [Leptospira alstonii serovar Pingchang str. 80-412]|uniref:Uncharacterized protein n=2 Tax=Leptospira alstonii TaxID=28452 RepID=M6CXQ2_9LEPT|nr:hypothetical protein LEP1GSC194_2062 [Leptospira alstonii serovar Sichuan str. 79601]EQA79128.1 hypothetical protein LEP1GSC193_0309 [Leptospira alstonii serovar Pingchang str. 80-412]
MEPTWLPLYWTDEGRDHKVGNGKVYRALETAPWAARFGRLRVPVFRLNWSDTERDSIPVPLKNLGVPRFLERKQSFAHNHKNSA